jgi:hypothetical protein
MDTSGVSVIGIIIAIPVHVIDKDIQKMNSLKKALAAKTEKLSDISANGYPSHHLKGGCSTRPSRSSESGA